MSMILQFKLCLVSKWISFFEQICWISNDSLNHLLRQVLVATYWWFQCHFYISVTGLNQPRYQHKNSAKELLIDCYGKQIWKCFLTLLHIRLFSPLHCLCFQRKNVVCVNDSIHVYFKNQHGKSYKWSRVVMYDHPFFFNTWNNCNTRGIFSCNFFSLPRWSWQGVR